MEDLTREFLVENSSMNVKFLGNKTGRITAGAYLLSTAEILICLFDSNSKDENDNLSSSGTAVFLKFDSYTHWKMI